MADRTILRINNVSRGKIGGQIATNVVSVSEEFVHQIVPRFIPNLYQGPTVNQDHKWWEIKVVLDSDTDIFDAFYAITAANSSMNNFWLEFQLTPRCAVIDTPATYTSCNINIGAQTFTANAGDPYAIFEAGDEIMVMDAEDAANDGAYTIATVTPTVITTVGAPGANNVNDTTIKICRGTVETWYYDETYVTDRREGRIEEGRERHTYEYDFIALTAKTIGITNEPVTP